MKSMRRRTILCGLLAVVPGCATLGALESASRPMPTFELTPVPGGGGRQRPLTLVVARPDAPAAVDTDRILVKPDPLAVAYLPNARWSDDAPMMLQSIVVRSIAGTGRLAHVGPAQGGPVADAVLLLRIDSFQAEPTAEAVSVPIRVALAATLIRDRDQQLVARDFSGSATAASESAGDVVSAFQAALDPILPSLADWAVNAV
ncbi:MAG: ABC-type transport auxiliary lipoprotein family protein [Pseudomonadota bacterium]